MANEYAVNSADLASVADAIRAKGGTTEALAFPAGMVAAVEAISTGAGLNFEIVGGTTQPTNPVENTIWVNTDAEITGWVFSAEEPATPADGFVWIFTSSSSSVSFNALKKNGIQVYPISAKQYVNGAYVDVHAEIYQGGEWVKWIIHVVKDGIIGEYGFVSVQSGYTNPAKMTQYDGYIYLQTAVTGYNGIGATVEAIDLTNKTKVYAVIDVVQIGNTSSSYLPGIVVGTTAEPYSTSIAKTTTTKTGLQTLELDVSAIDQKCWIGIPCRASGSNNYTKIKVYDIYVK